MEVVSVAGGSSEGQRVGAIHPHLDGITDLRLTSIAAAGSMAEVCFSCLPHGLLPTHLNDVSADLVVDLAEDFRGAADWVYGLPELTSGELQGARLIANPGCYPTASLLCLAPFVGAGWLDRTLIIDALSGVSGAGRSPRDDLLFAALDGGAAAYGSVPHRHVAEIERGLARFGAAEVSVSFTPHLVPMARGLLVTARGRLTKRVSNEDALEVLRSAYDGRPFVHVIDGWPATKAVSGTNRVQLSARVDPAGFLICSAAIDNLGKGAGGQALQNANIALGLDEVTGLEAVAAWP